MSLDLIELGVLDSSGNTGSRGQLPENQEDLDRLIQKYETILGPEEKAMTATRPDEDSWGSLGRGSPAGLRGNATGLNTGVMTDLDDLEEVMKDV
jgi:hypothetical protein